MTLASVLALTITLQGVVASLLLVATGEVGRGAASRDALAAEAAWRTVAADGAELARATAATLLPGETRVVTVPAPGVGWDVVAHVTRAAVGDVAALRLDVARRDDAGVPLAARQGTLILSLPPADTAVIGFTGSGAP